MKVIALGCTTTRLLGTGTISVRMHTLTLTTNCEAADICIRGVQTNQGAGIQIAFGSSCGAGHYHQAKPVHGAVNLDGTPVKFPPVPNHLPVPVHNQPIGKPIGTWGMFKKS